MRANCRITRLVIAGERSASPAATVWIAAISCSGGSSLRTNPLAPARSASYTYSSRSNVGTLRLPVLGGVERRQDQDPRRRVALEDAPRRLEPVELRHADVHQDDVRVEPLRF